MKRYMVFAFNHYYPCGGMSDFIESYDTWKNAKDSIRRLKEAKIKKDVYEIYDTKHGNLVEIK